MKTPCDEIQDVLQSRRFAVLATQQHGQPHASLMAFTPMNGIRHLILATYRATLKYRSLCEDGRVAILIDSRSAEEASGNRGPVITAHGHVAEVPPAEHEAVYQAHLNRHPDFECFFSSPDCALLRMDVKAYELVGGTEDVRWCQVADLAPGHRSAAPACGPDARA